MRFKDLLILHTGKDGGPESHVDGLWLLRWKAVCTVALLRFKEGSREAYHSHAFHSVSWLLRGKLEEHRSDGHVTTYNPSLKPILTRRTTTHKVYGRTPTSWVLTLRGPWKNEWVEILPDRGTIQLTHNRVEIPRQDLPSSLETAASKEMTLCTRSLPSSKLDAAPAANRP